METSEERADCARLCKLLVEKGCIALRAALQEIHSCSSLAAVLNANKNTLKTMSCSIINPLQWTLLFPDSGTPDPKNFDVTLLNFVLTYVCSLHSPTAGWNAIPPASDTSISANILRIKISRNKVYKHVENVQWGAADFEALWQEVSEPFVQLGKIIDEIKDSHGSEESYIEKLKEWKEQEDILLSVIQEGVKNEVNVNIAPELQLETKLKLVCLASDISKVSSFSRLKRIGMQQNFSLSHLKEHFKLQIFFFSHFFCSSLGI